MPLVRFFSDMEFNFCGHPAVPKSLSDRLTVDVNGLEALVSSLI